MEDEQLLYAVALSQLAGVGPQLTRQLVSYCGSPKAVFDTLPGRLLRIPGIGKSVAAGIHAGSKTALAQAEKVLKQAQEQDVRLLFYTSSGYPDRLKQLPDSPPLLFFRGNGKLNAHRVVSIVGTRQCTAYGQKVAEQIVEALKPYKVLVVNGLAYGIDIVAHRAALQVGLPTVGVMASGPDIVYPAAHRKYAERMLAQGGLLTENPFGTKPDAPRFPARNRIIAGMADCTIVVEAALKSGSLITADIAHSYDREVMAVPGNINAAFSEGTNFLIRSHQAAMYTCIQDLVALLNWDIADAAVARRAAAFNPGDFTVEECKVLLQLQESRQALIDDLSWKTQIPVGQLASLLLGLEFRGLIRQLPGKKFVLADT